MERKEQLLEAVFGTMRSRQGSDCHIATSPRRDVGSRSRSSRKCPGFVPLFTFLIFSDIRTMLSLLNDFIFSFIMF